MHCCLPLVAMTPKFAFGVSNTWKRFYFKVSANRRRKNYKIVKLLVIMKKKRKIIKESLKIQSQRTKKKRKVVLEEIQTVYNVDHNNQ